MSQPYERYTDFPVDDSTDEELSNEIRRLVKEHIIAVDREELIDLFKFLHGVRNF